MLSRMDQAILEEAGGLVRTHCSRGYGRSVWGDGRRPGTGSHKDRARRQHRTKIYYTCLYHFENILCSILLVVQLPSAKEQSPFLGLAERWLTTWNAIRDYSSILSLNTTHIGIQFYSAGTWFRQICGR